MCAYHAAQMNILLPYLCDHDEILVEALAELDANVYAVLEQPDEDIRTRLKAKFNPYVHILEVPSRFHLQASHSEHIEFLKQKMKAFIEQYNIDLIFPSAGFDARIMEAVGDLNQTLNLRGLNSAQRALLWDKAQYTQKLATAGLPVPRSQEVIAHTHFPHNPEALNYPCICKPVLGFGSEGVFVAYSPQDLEEFFSLEESPKGAKEYSLFYRDKVNGKFRRYNFCAEGGAYEIQEFIEGETLSLCGVKSRNEVRIDLVYKIESSTLPYRAEQGFVWNTGFEKLQESLQGLVTEALGVLDFPEGPFMMDLIRNKEGKFFIIDFSPRLSSSGSRLSFWLYGKNNFHCQEALKALWEPETPLSPTLPKKLGAVVMRYLPLPKGEVLSFSQGHTDESILYHDLDLTPGTFLFEPRTDFQIGQRGFVIAQGKTLDEAENNWWRFYNSLNIKVKAFI